MGINLPTANSFDWVSRSLPSSVLEEYGVGITNSDLVLFPALDLDHAVIGYQTRPIVDGEVTREFRSHGPAAIFGMHTHKKGNATLIICEGATDAMTMKLLYPHATCVGIPGTGNIKLVAQQLPWVRTFKNVVIAFDGDPAGVEAAGKLLQMLPRGRTRVVSMEPDYDCNRYLTEGLTAELRGYVDNAAGLEDDSFLTVADAAAHDAKGQSVPVSTGFSHIDDMLGGGLYSSELILVAGYTGSGKSEITNNVMDNIASGGTDVLYIADEMAPHQTLRRLRAIRYGSNFIPKDKIAALDVDILKHIHIYKKQEMELNDIVSVVERAVAELGVKVVFIDTICGIGNYMAKYTDADNVIRRLNKLSQGNINEQVPPVAIWGVVHTQGSEVEDITISSIRGGSSIRQQATAVLGVCKVEDLTSTDRTVKLLKLPRNNDCKRKEDVQLSYSTTTRKYTQDVSSGEVHGARQLRQQTGRKLSQEVPATNTPPKREIDVLPSVESKVPTGVDANTVTVSVRPVEQEPVALPAGLPRHDNEHVDRDKGVVTQGGQEQDASSVETVPQPEVPVCSTGSGIPINPARQRQIERIAQRKLERAKATQLGETQFTG